ncbi:hypothetical protein SH501x_003747 [Pirellulaceae bacterium SH501]
MKKTWFHGLALSLGISTLPSFVQAQYGGPAGGLSPSSFQLPPLPGQSATAAAPRTLPAPMPQGTMVSYAQQGGTIGSGALDPYSHVPLPPPPPVTAPGQLPMPNASPDPYVLGQPRPYELSPAPQTVPSPQYQGEVIQPGAIQPYTGETYPSSPATGCPTCATGNCSLHGANSSLLGPSYGDLSIGDSCAPSNGCYEPTQCAAPSVVAPNPWIFGASALIFTRVDDTPVRLTSDSNMPTYPLLSTGDARMRTSGGVQGSVGRYFGCGRFALVGTYWGIYDDEQSMVITPPPGGNLRSDLPFTLRRPGDTAIPGSPYGVTMPGQSVYDWYDMAAAHRIRRDSEFHNVELNLFSFALGGGARQAYAGCGSGGHCGLFGRGGDACGDACGDSCAPATGPTGPCAPWYGAQCSRLRLSMFGGVRWFRFGDELEYATSETDTMFGNGSTDDFYYVNDVTNDLVGFQFGTLATWCAFKRVNLYGSTAFGVYNNHIRTYTYAGTETEAATVLSPSSVYNGREYVYNNSTNDLAFLGEGTLGTGICLCRGWSANVGYRVVAVSGVATAVGQIPRDFSNGLEINKISNDRSLILHGAVLGLNYNF